MKENFVAVNSNFILWNAMNQKVRFEKKTMLLKEKIEDAVTNEEIIALCSKLVKARSDCEAPNNFEGKVSELIRDELTASGSSVEYYEVAKDRFNVSATIPGRSGNRCLVLNGHMDTVPIGDGWSLDPLSARYEGDRVFGRGTADMKGGLTAMIISAKILKRLKIKLQGDFLLSAVIDEEVGGLGTTAFLKERRGTEAIVCEPTDLKICTSQKGQLMYEINVNGKAAHSSLPELGVNAIAKMAELIRMFDEYSDALKKRSGSKFGNPTLNVGTIGGGSSTNTVPSSCKITFDRRLIPSETIESVERELFKIINQFNNKNAISKASMRRFYSIGPFETSSNVELVKDLGSAKTQFSKDKDIGTHQFSATCDAGILSPLMPVAIFGPGSLSVAHKPDEFVHVSEILSAAKIYAMTAISRLTVG